MFRYEPSWTDSAVRRFIGKVGPGAIEELFALREADNAGSGVARDADELGELRARVEAELRAGPVLDRSALAIDGSDLITELGLAPGPGLGRVLEALRRAGHRGPGPERGADAPAPRPGPRGGRPMIEPLLEAERAMSFGLLDQAERLYRQVADHDPRNSIAVVGLARVALERGDERTAYAEAKRALAIDPDNPAAQHLVMRLTEVFEGRGEAPPEPEVPATEPVVGVADPRPGPRRRAPPAQAPQRPRPPPGPPPMKILVTGGAGYVGSVSAEALVAAGHDVVVLDDLSTGHRRAVPDGAALETGTYADGAALAAVLEREQIEAILHCAARSLVGESGVEPAKYYRDNVAGGVALLEAARTAGVGRLVFSSSAAVYGVPGRVADPRGRPAPAHQHVRRDEADVRGRDGRLRPGVRPARRSACATSTSPAPPSASARTTTPRPTSSRTSSPRPPARGAS